MDINIYTDGSAMQNPGNGGYAVLLTCGDYKKELSAGYRFTTNNRMELLAVIVGLEALKKPNSNVTVFSDSMYVICPIQTKTIFKYYEKKFVKTKNPDLWVRFMKVYEKHNVKFVWVKGHSGHPQNDRCDYLAKNAANDKKNFQEDHGYSNLLYLKRNNKIFTF
jgi:ribonuclease HI